MIVKFDSLNRFEVPQMYICNPGSVYNANGTVSNTIGILNNTSDEEIVFNFNAQSELNFRAYKTQHDTVEENEYALKKYRSLQNRRVIFVDGIGFFIIKSVVDGYSDGQDYKDVTAYSCEAEIENKNIPYIENNTYNFKDLLDSLVSTLPRWTIGHIATSIETKYRTFEDVAEDKNVLGFFLEDMQEAYECIFIFDIINRVINVYDQNDYVVQTPIHLTKDNFINGIEITENSEDLYTALSIMGDENLNIIAINPLGTNTIYNFDYYLSWMSDGLKAKVEEWQQLVKDSFDNYYNLNLEYYQLLTDRYQAEYDIDMYTAQLTMYQRCKENIVAESDTNIAEDYNAIIIANGGEPIVVTNYDGAIQATLANIDACIASTDDEELKALYLECRNAVVEQYNINSVSDYNEEIVSSGGVPIEIVDEVEETLKQIENLIAETNSKLLNTQSLCDNYGAQMIPIQEQIQSIKNAVSFETYFTQEEYDELYNFIFEGNYQDEYITITDAMTYADRFEQMKTLYDRAMMQIEKISKPTQEFSIDLENFLFVKDFQEWSSQLETGCLINIELDYQDVAPLFLSAISVNYYDKTLSFTFGNRFNKFDPKSLFKDALGDIKKSANSINYIKDILYPISSGKFNEMEEVINNSRTLTKNAALSSTNQEVIIDEFGYMGRRLLDDGTYDNRQIKIIGNNILFTDDGWQTCKLAIGEIILEDGSTVYGVNAQTLIGNLIMGNSLKIYDNKGNELLSVIDGQINSQISDIVYGDEEQNTEDGTPSLTKQISSLKQTADSLEAIVGKVTTNLGDEENPDYVVNEVVTAQGYKFGAEGLIINDRGSTAQENIKNKLDNTGMYVTRGVEDEAVLTANMNGVNAINLTAKQYLVMGDYSRFENYATNVDSHRTACFYIEPELEEVQYGDY